MPVISIGESAFKSCSELTSVTIPNSIKSINGYAFYGCSSLESVTLPESVISLSGNAFSSSGIKKIYIPESVTEIDGQVFLDTPWLEVKKAENPLVVVNNILIDGTACTDDVVIPDGVTSISSNAFEQSDILSVVIPESVSTIGDLAFFGNEMLKSIVIKNPDCKIGLDDDYGLTISNSYDVDYNGVYNGTIYGHENSTAQAYAEKYGYNFEIIASSSGAEPLVYEKIDEDEDGTYDYIEITGCADTVTAVEIPAEIEGLPVTSIGNGAFHACERLTSITIPDSVTSIGFDAFSETPWLEAKQAENPLVIINDILIHGKTCKGDVAIPDSVTSIVDYAFMNCDGLTSITVGDNVTSIGYGAFYACEGLTSVTIENPECEIYDESGYTISNGYDEDYNGYFNGTIYGHENSTAQAYAEKYGYNFEIIASSSGAEPLVYEKIDEDKDGIYDYVEITGCNETVAAVEIPAEIDGLPVKSIGNYAFYECSGLTNIAIPDSVTSIGECAFGDCAVLTSVTIPDGVTSIKEWTFSGCKGLTSITIPNSVTSIGANAFIYCESLISIKIPDSVTSIEEWTFAGCKGLTGITIPDSVTSIGDRAFYDCSDLTSVTISESVISIDSNAFGECASLASITIENPECEIYDSENTIFNGLDESYSSYFNGTIYGYENSTAQAYAEKYEYNFEALKDTPAQTTPVQTTVTTTSATTVTEAKTSDSAVETTAVKQTDISETSVSNTSSENIVTATTTTVTSVNNISLADFLNSGFNNSRFTVYDGTNTENSFQMMGEKFSQGLVGNVENYNFSVLDAEISFNVKNVDDIIFTLGHVDNTNKKNMTLYIYLDNELQYTLECEPNMNTTYYKLDTSKANSLRFYMDGENETSYALANIVINEDFSSVPEGSYNTDEIIELGVFYEPTDTTAPVKLPDDGSVYNGHTYKAIIDESITTWKEAQAYCQSLGGHLATISDSDENNFIYELIKKEKDVQRFRLGGYYTSLTDSWAWVDGTEFSYTNWSTDQPDNHENIQFCLTMVNQDVIDGTELLAGMWDDDYNYYADASYGFVCEWDEASDDNPSDDKPTDDEPTDDEPSDVVKGDANNDGKINVRDCAFIATALAKGQADTLPSNADFNEDGKINVRDAAAIAKWLANGGK